MGKTSGIVGSQLRDKRSAQSWPDQIAARILFGRCTRRHPDLRRRVASGSVAVVVEVPDVTFIEPVSEFFRGMLPTGAEMADGDLLADDSNPKRGWRWRLVEFRRGESFRFRARKYANDVVSTALAFGSTVVGIATVPERELPPDLLRVADMHVTVPPLDRTAVQRVISKVTGERAAMNLPTALFRSLSLNDLCLAVRPGSTAKECLLRLKTISGTKGSAPDHGPRLSDLHGLDEPRAWGESLALDLDAYRRGKLPWSHVDRGILLAGPPGTGKTMFAKALARTCDCPLVVGSLGRWQAAGHLGDLLKAMHRTVDEARKLAPSILFIDEIDGFGDRATFSHENHNYSTQVVNALLEELDGIQGREGVVVVGAANDADRLDPAIRRSGRLDRTIWLPLPDLEALSGIFRFHLASDLMTADLTQVAMAAQGSTGADVERWVRSARRTARRAQRPMAVSDLLAEVAAKSAVRSPDEHRRVALHEAGHAVAAIISGMKARQVSIFGDFQRGGYTAVAAPPGLSTRNQYRRRLMVLLSGRAAEEVVLGEPSDGSGGGPDSDIAVATATAMSMEACLGLGSSGDLLWRGAWRFRDMPWMFLREPELRGRVSELLREVYAEAVAAMHQHRNVLEHLSEVLITRGYVSGEELLSFCQGRKSFAQSAPGNGHG